MSEPLTCAECNVVLTTADAEDAVPTDAGPVHRECFEGPVPVGAPKAGEVVFDEYDALVELPPGYLLPPGKTMADVRAMDAELLASEGIDLEAENDRRREMGDRPLTPEEEGPHCPECGDPVERPGRCPTCRGRSMQP